MGESLLGGEIAAYLRVSSFHWELSAQSGRRLGERSGRDLGPIWAIVLGSHFWEAKSQRTFEYVLSIGYCLPSLGDVWASDLGAIWDRSGRSFWGVTFGRRNRSVPSSIIFPLGTVCPVWETSGRAIWERSGTDLGDRSGESLLGGEIAASLRVSSFHWELSAQSGRRL